MKKLIIYLLVMVYGAGYIKSQLITIPNLLTNENGSNLKSATVNGDLSNYKSPKRLGHYSTDQWIALSDSFWGPGLSADIELKVFDEFWTKVDQSWGGFPNLNLNWDSVKNLYRPEIAKGVSRGRFGGILSQLTLNLLEYHAYINDPYLINNIGFIESEYPNFPSFYYKPGIPFSNFRSLPFTTNFGAGLTLLKDSSIVVYNVIPNHPLGLQPGDIILGYDGIPWKTLLKELSKAELVSSSTFSSAGSSPESRQYILMTSAGMNWGLYDTIDIVKYPNNDTLHLPTSLLWTLKPPYLISTDQLPVKGVPFPNIENKDFVSWGTVEGTNVGYIYCLDWGRVSDNSDIFKIAVNELVNIKHVSGLIIDFRTNLGGRPKNANYGLNYLFNTDPTDKYSNMVRADNGGHLTFTKTNYDDFSGKFTPTNKLFDRPIAVLLGPLCLSAGDYNAFRLRFHPMARSFGKPTSGAYTSPPFNVSSVNNFNYRIDQGCVYSNVGNEGYMIHKSFPVDNSVWFTREGVAKGKDDVVDSAINWINNVAYAHDVTLNKTFFESEYDSVTISASIENPRKHPLKVLAILNSLQNNKIDTLELKDDGLHHDGEAKDNKWCNTGYYKIDNTINVTVITKDSLSKDTIRLSNVTRFTSIGPVKLDSFKILVNDNIVNAGDNSVGIKPYLKNLNSIKTASNITAKLICLDTSASNDIEQVVKFSDIKPLTNSIAQSQFFVNINKNSKFCSARFELNIYSDNFHFWSDTFSVYIYPRRGAEIYLEEDIKDKFNLEQNFPNPCNTSTTIKYQLAGKQYVSIKIFNIHGQLITTLVNAYEEAGKKSILLNTSSLRNGIYYYQLESGNDFKTRKMIVIK